MTQTSYPFEGIDTTETQFSKWAKHFNNGVNDEPSGTALEVSVGTGLAVDVEAGEAMVRGHYYISDATESLALATADATNDRLDLVVLKLDPTANSITLAVKTGTPAGSPVAPTPVQTEAGIFEQPLAEVLVPATSGVPTTITDRREFMGTRLGSWTTDGRPTPAGRVLFGFNTTTGQIEFYNVNTSSWAGVSPESIGDIGDVTITSAAEGDSLVYDGTDWVNSSNVVSGRNLLYNGAMQVAQRGTSVTGIGNGDNGYHTADRWSYAETGAVTFALTNTIENDGPTGSGFTKSNKWEVTTAQSSLASNDRVRFDQALEGQDVQALKKGTASAESLTLSFWVKSNVTGTYIATLLDSDNTRGISAAYTVSSSGTWEKKTITFPGDTSGVLDNDNDASLRLQFYLLAGTDYTSGTLSTSWAALNNPDTAVGQVNLAATVGNYWQITGVQLEAGTVATPFEHKAYGVELTECQRYFNKRAANGIAAMRYAYVFYRFANVADCIYEYPVVMRAVPTLQTGGTFEAFNGGSVAGTSSTLVIDNTTSIYAATLQMGSVSGTIGNAGMLRDLGAASFISFDAEL